jgi:hypothetical protein
VTPKHNALVDAMLQCKAHFIATMRVKMEYVQEKNEKGKTEIKKVGLAKHPARGHGVRVHDRRRHRSLAHAEDRQDALDGVMDIGDQFEKAGRGVRAEGLRLADVCGAEAARRQAAVQQPTVSDALDATFASTSLAREGRDAGGARCVATGSNKPAKGTRNYDIAVERVPRSAGQIASRRERRRRRDALEPPRNRERRDAAR